MQAETLFSLIMKNLGNFQLRVEVLTIDEGIQLNEWSNGISFLRLKLGTETQTVKVQKQ